MCKQGKSCENIQSIHVVPVQSDENPGGIQPHTHVKTDSCQHLLAFTGTLIHCTDFLKVLWAAGSYRWVRPLHAQTSGYAALQRPEHPKGAKDDFKPKGLNAGQYCRQLEVGARRALKILSLIMFTILGGCNEIYCQVQFSFASKNDLSVKSLKQGGTGWVSPMATPVSTPERFLLQSGLLAISLCK